MSCEMFLNGLYITNNFMNWEKIHLENEVLLYNSLNHVITRQGTLTDQENEVNLITHIFWRSQGAQPILNNSENFEHNLSDFGKPLKFYMLCHLLV